MSAVTRPGTPAASVPLSFLSPGSYVAGDGVIKRAGEIVARFGSNALLVHGAVGFGLAGDALDRSLSAAGVRYTTARQVGYCGDESSAALTAAARAAGSDVLVGVGGGRALDVTKLAADSLGLPCVMVPTSPATCSAATSVVVRYTTSGEYLGSGLIRRNAEAAVVDVAVLAAAPDRLLVAGIADALAKVVEVRFAASRITRPGTALLAALALCDELDELLHAQSRAALAGSPDARARVAEACVLWPGLIGALAGESAKLAAAHAVHNALTILPASHQALHGELVAFGVIAQLLLEERSDDYLERTVALLSAIGCPLDLESLGCRDYLTDESVRNNVLTRICSLQSMRACFPNIAPAALAEVLLEANGVALEARAGIAITPS